MKNDNKNLYYLEELDHYKVKDSDKDCRGWEVKDKDNRVVGKVDNFLVNKETEKVVYFDIKVDDSIIESDYKPYSKSANDGVHGFVNKDGENHIILPVGMAYINEDDNCLQTEEIDHRTFAETKRIKKGQPIDREYEILVIETYHRDSDKGSASDNSFYDNECFVSEEQTQQQ